MLHHKAPLQEFALKLIQSVTSDAAGALNLECGSLKVGNYADFALVTLPELPRRPEEIALWTILHTREVDSVYIEGEMYV